MVLVITTTILPLHVCLFGSIYITDANFPPTSLQHACACPPHNRQRAKCYSILGGVFGYCVCMCVWGGEGGVEGDEVIHPSTSPYGWWRVGGVACWTKHYGWSHYRRHYCMLLHSHSLMQRLECPLIFLFQQRGMFLLEEILFRIDSADPLIKNFCQKQKWISAKNGSILIPKEFVRITHVRAKMKKYLYILSGMSEVS